MVILVSPVPQFHGLGPASTGPAMSTVLSVNTVASEPTVFMSSTGDWLVRQSRPGPAGKGQPGERPQPPITKCPGVAQEPFQSGESARTGSDDRNVHPRVCSVVVR